MNILKDIKELLEAKVISTDIAVKIQEYYTNKKEVSNSNKLLIVFRILGTILVGLGIILILTNNWDSFTLKTQIILSFVPLLLAQVSCFYVFYKKHKNITLKETVSVFWFFSTGASIFIVNEIYHISIDKINSFLFLWAIMSISIVYIMQSSVTSLLYIVCISFYSLTTHVQNFYSEAYLYIILLLLIIPYYYNLYKKNPTSVFMVLHNWAIPISITISLMTVGYKNKNLLFLNYFSLFALFYTIGNYSFFSKQKLIKSAYSVIGAIGMAVVLLLVSSKHMFGVLLKDKELNKIILSSEFISWAALSASIFCLSYIRSGQFNIKKTSAFIILYSAVSITFFLGFFTNKIYILISIYIFIAGLLTIVNGARKNSFIILNFGLLIISALIIIRFFSSDINITIKSITFIFIGISFFISNYFLLKKNTDE